MHFTGLACTKFSEPPQNAKIAKFITLRYVLDGFIQPTVTVSGAKMSTRCG